MPRVYTIIPEFVDEPLSLRIHRPHGAHMGSIFALDGGGMHEAVAYGERTKLEFMQDRWERQFQNTDPAYLARLQANHRSAAEFALPDRVGTVGVCAFFAEDFKTIDWRIRIIDRDPMDDERFRLLLHASQVVTRQGKRRHLSMTLEFQRIVGPQFDHS